MQSILAKRNRIVMMCVDEYLIATWNVRPMLDSTEVMTQRTQRWTALLLKSVIDSIMEYGDKTQVPIEALPLLLKDLLDLMWE
eukprot:966445-Amorphochlora_amoeboformis.AAC.1